MAGCAGCGLPGSTEECQALFEELNWEPITGRPYKTGYHFAHILTHLESPNVQVHFVDMVDPYGPFGAKPVGEPPVIPGGAAVANAVSAACGARVTELPLTPERVRRAMLEPATNGRANGH